MIYSATKADLGFAHDPFKAIVAPRPIGWISTLDAQGRANLAPYSFFNAVAYVPPQVMFASTSAKPDRDGTKDSVAQIRETGVFCVNIVEHAAREAMNLTSKAFPRETDEFAAAGVPKAECLEIDCPRVDGAPANLECRLTQIVTLPGKANFLVLGEVVGFHLRDDCLRDGRFDVTAFQPVSRLGYRDFATVTEVFEMIRPDD